MKRYKPLFESNNKTLYHFTRFENLLPFLKSNYILKSSGGFISFTRNYKMQNEAGSFTDAYVRIAIDKEKFNDNLKRSFKISLEPFQYGDSSKEDRAEQEERIKRMWISLLKYIKQIDILNKVKKTEEYDDLNMKEIEDKLKNDRIDLNFVDTWRPVK